MTSTELDHLRAVLLTVIDDGRITYDLQDRMAGKIFVPWNFYDKEWRKDTPESNDERGQFADEVQQRLIKSIQRAEDENGLICGECGLRNGHSAFCRQSDFTEALKEM